VAPKGSKVRQEDTRIIVERTNAYMMRRFQDIEDRLTQLKAEQEQLKKEIEKIKMQFE
jgi:TolA-binding protein